VEGGVKGGSGGRSPERSAEAEARKVSAATGSPVASYLRRIKLNQASERLIHTTVPANTISAELGFSSDSSMRRMFKDLTALTPTEYRQAFGRT
jgi:AraC-like DNA-binding protein